MCTSSYSMCLGMESMYQAVATAMTTCIKLYESLHGPIEKWFMHVCTSNKTHWIHNHIDTQLLLNWMYCRCCVCCCLIHGFQALHFSFNYSVFYDVANQGRSCGKGTCDVAFTFHGINNILVTFKNNRGHEAIAMK